MGIFDVVGDLLRSSSNELSCPKCGSDVCEQDVRYYCASCDIRFIFEDGRLLDPFDPLDWDSGRTCANCQSSLSGDDYVGEWEEGNPESYTICPTCEYHN